MLPLQKTDLDNEEPLAHMMSNLCLSYCNICLKIHMIFFGILNVTVPTCTDCNSIIFQPEKG